MEGPSVISWIDDSLPLPAARPLEGGEALEATAHAFAALAAGIAAMQLLMAVVLGDTLAASFFAVLLVATGWSAFVADGSRWRRAAYLAGGSASVLVWLTMVPAATGAAMAVACAMAVISAVITRQLLVDGTEPDEAPSPHSGRNAAPVGWIEDDREGILQVALHSQFVATIHAIARRTEHQ